MKAKKEDTKQNEIKYQPINSKSQKRSELEKELNIQRNQKNKKNPYNISDLEMNHLNYYNEIAKNNIKGLMNNPTLKDLIRITKDESCLEQLKALEKSKDLAKDLAKLLQVMPLKRVERINYKNLEIGELRKSLKTNYVYINKEKGRNFANNVFTRRLKQSGKYVPVKSIDDLYKHKTIEQNKEEKKNLSDNKNNNFYCNQTHKAWRRRNIYTQASFVSNKSNNENFRTINNEDINNNTNKNRNENKTINESQSFVAKNKNYFLNPKSKDLNDNRNVKNNARIKHRNLNSFNDTVTFQNNTNIPKGEERIAIRVNKKFDKNDKKVEYNTLTNSSYRRRFYRAQLQNKK